MLVGILLVAKLELREEHVLHVVVVVAGDVPELLRQHQRRLQLEVAAAAQQVAHGVDQQVEDRRPLGVEEGEARRFLLEVEEIELLAQHAVVALARLLEQVEMLLQVLLLEEGGAVHAHELLALGVGAPVRTGNARELGVLQPARVRHVGAAAEIDELPVPVERDLLAALLDVVDDLALELVVPAVDRAVARERFVGVLVRDRAAFEGVRLLREPLHLLLDLREVVRRDRAVGHEDVVVEAVLDHRADGELRLGEDPQDRVGHQVGGGVAQDLERLFIALGEQANLRAVFERAQEIDDLLVHHRGDGGLGEAGADLGGQISGVSAFLELTRAAVRQVHLDHGASPSRDGYCPTSLACRRLPPPAAKSD